ncbi:MAG: 4-hydroxyphenylpyruvate dioxygenase [Candidatus Marinimicrobia bacterium]|nr:4-hydroxyphenylpyruvate dioxygenase [Candidatus Neomarinimicrobiota bacterium]
MSDFQIHGTDYVQFIVGNAKQAARYYEKLYGFKITAYQGLETGNREATSYLLQQNKIRFLLTTPLTPESQLNDHLYKHGDAVKDVAFWVDNARAAWEYATGHGAESVREPREVSDEYGKVVLAAIKTYGDTIHTFVERSNYNGVFLPGFEMVDGGEVSKTGLKFIDHIVGNQPDGQMEPAVNWYQTVLDFHRFWTVDDKDISTEYSALRSIVVANDNERIKMPINEPADGLKKSQIQEFVDYYGGPGVQHIAMDTSNIIQTVRQLRKNGVDFLDTPQSYYDALPGRVGEIDEDIRTLADLGILVDADDDGYMLQIFTKPILDRPTVFFEIIQRKGSQSFGKGNFKALFESIEREQARRGNL